MKTFEEQMADIKQRNMTRRNAHKMTPKVPLRQETIDDMVTALLDNRESKLQRFEQLYRKAEPWERMGLIGEII